MNTYKRHRFPPDIISYAVWFYYRFNLTYWHVPHQSARAALSGILRRCILGNDELYVYPHSRTLEKRWLSRQNLVLIQRSEVKMYSGHMGYTLTHIGASKYLRIMISRLLANPHTVRLPANHSRML
jgi:hypothetical protein